MAGLIQINQQPVRPVPASAGIGLRAPHVHELLQRLPALDWLEVHSENYFGRGIPFEYLVKVREHYDLSLHGVGLSVGSTDALDGAHLRQLRDLIARLQPVLVSEHLSWSSAGCRFLNDLLPLPYTEEALDHLVSRVAEIQDRLGRQLLIENISSYLEYRDSQIPEWEFLAELAARSGCGILLDVNNIYVSACNHKFSPFDYLRGIPAQFVQEIHLAGFTRNRANGVEILIDTHSRRVVPEVWYLYATALAWTGQVATLIEWDTDLPALDVLLDEARIAQNILDRETGHANVA
jgi:uncharacterized protein (UPF0276 family)